MCTRKSMLPSSSVVLLPNVHHVVVAVCIFGQLLWICRAACVYSRRCSSGNPYQTYPDPASDNYTTDPSEAKILNSVFQKWGISATAEWNISGELCSGADTASTYPYIRCNCSYNNGTTCHIVALYAFSLNINGTIPDELWNLTYLNALDLSTNLLSGSLSPAIRKLTQLQHLYLSNNRLSGHIPIEIGQLTEMTILNLWTNNFSGSLPSEIGNLLKLEQLILGINNFSGSLPSEIGNLLKLEKLSIDSLGLSGEIPTTFAKLQRLKTVWASNNAFIGKIPDFIGSWSNLTFLELQGNSFEGPIPLTISNLTLLTRLRLSDVTNGSSSLEFIKGLTNLKALVLRNNNISSSIPSYIGEYKSLSLLDLSFNNLVGPIPSALLGLNLSYLFLGNNKLKGTLPTQINNPYLKALDVSYNDLRGSLPTWVHEQKQINLVGNNFIIDYVINSSLPPKLNCLQRNFPCNSKDEIHNGFSVKCGGFDSDNMVFERDDQPLGPATYHVADLERWAVSNVRYFIDGDNPTNTLILSQTSNLSSSLFQSARISASSLRYYGLGLENGNYIVILQFDEIAIQNPIGRRIFDIYIQGTLVAKDFDIRKEAGGSSNVGVKREFSARVSQNHLEIHLFWAGKGTCCVPQVATYGPLISAISVTSARSHKEDQTSMIVEIAVGVGVAGLFVLLLTFYKVRQRRKAQAKMDEELLGMDAKPYTFSYGELKTATEDFNPINKLGEGGYGPVFKGMLNDGTIVAVKQLSLASHQGKNQFIAEIATISAVQHRNLVKLYGCCIKGNQRLLVYEYMENKSLDKALFGERSLALEWGTRYEICLGIARGLAYLHEESRLRIVHRDVKASNILLDSNLVPKISDFGLAKLYDDEKTHMSTRVAGTFGYLAPEYAMRGHLTEKADVFAFGVVALEIISGRPNLDLILEEDKVYLLELAWNLYETNQEVDLVDSRLSTFNEEEVKRVVRVALLCTQTSPTNRPSMSRVVAMLSGDIEVSRVATKPGYLTDWKFCDQTSFMRGSTSKEAKKSDYYNTSLNSSTPGGDDLSPIEANEPMLPEIIG